MYKKLPLEIKKSIIERIKNGEQITSLASEFGVSRTIIYKWYNKYISVGPKAKIKSLTEKQICGNKHWKSITSEAKRHIVKLAIKHPELTPRAISAQVGVSIHGVWNALKDLNLNTIEKRRLYVAQNGTSLYKELPYDSRVILLRRFEQGENVSRLCREYKISRTTFYNIYRRYINANKSYDALKNLRPKGESHWRFTPGVSDIVLEIVIEHPEFPLNKITEAVSNRLGALKVGRHGIYNILKKFSLNTYQKRYIYSQNAAPIAISNKASQVTDWRQPSFAKKSFISVIPPPLQKLAIKSLPALLLSLAALTFIGSVYYLSVTLFAQATSLGSILGLSFSLIALIFGSFFFIYSMKYYVTIGMVLSFSRHSNEDEEGGEGSVWSRVFASNNQKRSLDSGISSVKGSGLDSDLSDVYLNRRPFVSIHLATYNERKVVDRLLTAATSQDYENYEVIIVDDSTDESIQVLEKWRNHPRVKVIHRESRAGYKGGALNEALKITNPKAEYVAIFDADFIPYPDTITHFLKYMQSLAGSLTPKAIASSNVAAIQGYQWHVLNKSENWITRGVRTEYAGSYVIERAGTELYQGLKQIAGSVYMIRADVLQQIGWGTSITEDFELTLKLYNKGYKVVYTPYIQAPAEAVSTIKRLIRQRMRWAEGHSFNIKRMFNKLMFGDEKEKQYLPSRLSFAEKFEVAYLTPYYLQAAFFLIGTFSWFVAEVIFKVRLPFWTEVWGWSLILTNMFALPLMNLVGLFLEESEEKDYLGLFSFVILSYIVAPFQAYAAIKGFAEKEEGPWFRTPKTGKITDAFTPGKFYRYIFGIFGKKTQSIVGNKVFAASAIAQLLSGSIANNTAIQQFGNQAQYTLASSASLGKMMRPKHMKWIGKVSLTVLLLITITISQFAYWTPTVKAAGNTQIKTVEFYVYQYASGTDITSGNGIDNTAYSGDGARFDADLPETSVTIRTAWVEWRTVYTGTANATAGEMKFKRSGQSAITQTLASTNAIGAASGENVPMVFRQDVTSAIASGLNTYFFNAQLTGDTRNSDAAKLYVTYEYDDSSATQMVTRRYEVGCGTGAETSGTNTDYTVNPGIGEASAATFHYWVEYYAKRDAANVSTDGTFLVKVGGTSSNTYTLDGSNQSDYSAVLFATTSASLNLNSNNTITLNNAGLTTSLKCAELVVTYSINYYETTDTNRTNTVRYFLGQTTTALSTTANTQIGSQTINLPENSLSFKSAYVKYWGYADGTSNAHTQVTVNGTANTDTTYTVQSNTTENTGPIYILSDATSQFTSAFANGSTVRADMWATAANNIYGVGAELIITYEYAGTTSTTGIKTVQYWVGQEGDNNHTNDFLDSTLTGQNNYQTWYPESSKTLRNAQMQAFYFVGNSANAVHTRIAQYAIDSGASTPGDCTTAGTTRDLGSTSNTDTGEQIGVETSVQLSKSISTTANSDIKFRFCIDVTTATTKVASPISIVTYEVTIPTTPEATLVLAIIFLFGPKIIALIMSEERRRKDKELLRKKEFGILAKSLFEPYERVWERVSRKKY